MTDIEKNNLFFVILILMDWHWIVSTECPSLPKEITCPYHGFIHILISLITSFQLEEVPPRLADSGVQPLHWQRLSGARWLLDGWATDARGQQRGRDLPCAPGKWALLAQSALASHTEFRIRERAPQRGCSGGAQPLAHADGVQCLCGRRHCVRIADQQQHLSAGWRQLGAQQVSVTSTRRDGGRRICVHGGLHLALTHRTGVHVELRLQGRAVRPELWLSGAAQAAARRPQVPARRNPVKKCQRIANPAANERLHGLGQDRAKEAGRRESRPA